MREKNERKYGVRNTSIFKNKLSDVWCRLLNTRDEVSAIFDISIAQFNNNF